MAAFFDLNSESSPRNDVTADVCVIGGGIAGLYLANRLTSVGLRVVVLEAGGPKCASGIAIGIEPIFVDDRYRGAEEGRAFGLGGTSSKWGGLLVPYSEFDRANDSARDASTWSHIVDSVSERGNAVFSALGLQGTTSFFSSPGVQFGSNAKVLRESGFEIMAAEALPFWRRNLRYLATGRKCRIQAIYLNAVASRWSAKPIGNDLGLVNAVYAISSAGHELRVSAKSFVIAAGAIESARILLEIDRATEGRMLPSPAIIGACLSDHLSCAIADVLPEDRTKAAEMFGPFFVKGRMRTLRFLERLQPRVPRHFCHFIFDVDNPGFRLVRDSLLGMQSQAPAKRGVSEAIGAIGGIGALAYQRFVRSRLFIPEGTPAHLQLDVEQAMDRENRVSLGADVDKHGRPVAMVRWRISDIDHENIRTISTRVLKEWPSNSGRFPSLVPISSVGDEPKPYDAYHPVGTCRMGSDEDSVVDLALRVRGTHNLYVLSTGVFPSAGAANPTFSMLCLGEMLKERLARDNAH